MEEKVFEYLIKVFYANGDCEEFLKGFSTEDGCNTYLTRAFERGQCRLTQTTYINTNLVRSFCVMRRN